MALAAEPALGPAAEPVLGPVAEPVLGPAAEPVLGPVAELLAPLSRSPVGSPTPRDYRVAVVPPIPEERLGQRSRRYR